MTLVLPQTAATTSEYDPINREGDVVSQARLAELVGPQIGPEKFGFVAGTHTRTVKLKVAGLSVRDRISGAIVPVEYVRYECVVDVVKGVMPIQLVRYQDADLGKPIAESAIAKIEIGDAHGDVVFTRTDDGQLRISVVGRGKKGPAENPTPPPEATKS